MLGKNNFLGPKNFKAQNFFWVQKQYLMKKNQVNKIFGSKIFGFNKIFGQKKFGPKKF